MGMIETDVLIVGGGPAGSACAQRLKENDIECLILDRQRFPRPKTCAGWITPEALQAMHITQTNYPHGLTRFTSFQISISHFQFTLPVHQYAIRRIEFDDWLLQQTGVPHEVHHVKKIEQRSGKYIIDDRYAGYFLVGAGGTTCPVRRTFFTQANPRDAGTLITAMEEEFIYEHVDDVCRLWFFENQLPGYAWYVPKSAGVINVGIGGNAAKLRARGSTIQAHWDMLINKLEESGLACNHSYTPNGYSYYLRQKRAQVRIGNALIAGDAVGLATRDMGEGIRTAIESGQMA
ncbi:MAG: NAD(P)/FAD-dependent oxidoreductase, partial [Anaerolineales bacterium]